MDLKSGKLFWPAQCSFRAYHPPPLSRDLACDVAIIGAGVSGALTAQALSRAGVSVVLLDKRGVGAGSTSASTALLLYEIDVPLHRLIRLRGRTAAVRSYRLCRDATDQLQQLSVRLGNSVGFRRRPSLYLARRASQRVTLRQELRERRRAGFRLEFLDRPEVLENFGYSAPAALHTEEAAEIDPFRLTQRAVQDAVKAGARVFAPVTVGHFDTTRTQVILHTTQGPRIHARRLIIAAGYESNRFLRRSLVRLRSTYALATQPLPRTFEPVPAMAWEMGRPYCYLRSTVDRRLMIGGGDEDFVSRSKRDRLLGRKGRELLVRLHELIPGLPSKLRAEFRWAGTFGDTRDGLPYVDSIPSNRNVLYLLCYGANGINFAMLGATLACDWVQNRRNRDLALFRFDR